MKIEEITAMWSEDCVVDPTSLGSASLSTPRLHSKYFRIFLEEKNLLLQLSGAMKLLRLEKYEMYTQGPTAEVASKWQQKTLPDCGVLLKGEAGKYIDADIDVLNLELKYNLQLEKVKFLEAIIGALKDRGYAIRNAIDYERFQMGG